jgi:CarboxypepD_reg-like domain
VKLAILFCLLTLPAVAQLTLRGQVLNAADGQPVPFASVFLTNTTKGTTANGEGQFVLTNVPNGRYELVASSVGFETWSKSIQTADNALVDVQLRPVTKLLNEVQVNAYGPAWQRHFELFRTSFLGTSQNAQLCFIQNPKALWFEQDPATEKLTGGAHRPLIIENRALGYRIQYILDRFEADPVQKTVTYLGHPVFEEMNPQSRREEVRWQRARLHTYAGSVLHFMRALYAQKTAEQGFVIRRILERAIDSSRVGNETWHVRRGRFLVKDPLPASFLLGDGEATETTKALTVETPMHVVYTGEPEPPEYQQSGAASVTLGRTTGVQTSILRLTKPLVRLEPNGNYYEPLGLAFEGYWGWEKIADLLPLTFDP